MRTNYRRMLGVTLDILHRGSYHTQQKTVDFKLSMERMEAARVFLPEDVRAIGERTDFACVHLPGKCGYSCENADSFSLAIRRYSDFPQFFAEKDTKEILVLNMANPVHPGGGVRFGARAQEEDLCRRSSLLLSLESEGARKYYEYNRSLGSDLGSLFHSALKNMKLNGMDSNELFYHIDFAVLDRTPKQYNFNEFARNFSSGNFIEKKMEA